MHLAQAGQLGVQLRDLLRRGEAVLGAEEAEQRAGEVRGEADQGRECEWCLRRWRAHDARAVAVDGGVEGELAGGEEALPASGAVSDDTELAVGRGEGAEMMGGGIHVADQAVVRHPAGRSHRRGGIVGAGALALALVEIGADGEVAGGGKGAGHLLAPAVPARHVVDDNDSAEGPVAHGLGEVGADLVAAVAGDPDRLPGQRVRDVWHGSAPDAIAGDCGYQCRTDGAALAAPQPGRSRSEERGGQLPAQRLDHGVAAARRCQGAEHHPAEL